MEFNVDRGPGLAEQVAQHLKEAIAAGEFAAGERLVETVLASRLGVSRAPLREALRELAGTGLVEYRPGRGAFVAQPTDSAVASMGVFRGLVEGAAASLVASVRSAAALEHLQAIQLRMADANTADDLPSFIALHWEFHRAICAESGNHLLLQSWDGVSRQIRLYLNMAVPKVDPNSVLRNNRAILHALGSASPDTAERLLRSLIIRQTYKVLKIPMPAAMAGYVTLQVDAHGEIRPVEGPLPADTV